MRMNAALLVVWPYVHYAGISLRSAALNASSMLLGAPFRQTFTIALEDSLSFVCWRSRHESQSVCQPCGCGRDQCASVGHDLRAGGTRAFTAGAVGVKSFVAGLLAVSCLAGIA